MDKYRYQVIAWDGCGIWHVSERITKSRRIARHIKNNYKGQKSYYTVRYRIVSLFNDWQAVKIWDRKLRKFIY